MRTTCAVRCWLAALLLAAGVAHAGGAREEQLRLQGTWQLLEIGVAGDTVKMSAVSRTVVIAGDKMAFSPKTEYRLRLAPTRQPREIDLTITKTNKVLKGIYELQNDTLTIYYTTTGRRPTRFEDRGKDGDVVRVMKYRRIPKEQK